MARVGLLCFSSAASTLGLEVVADAVREAYPDWHVEPVDETTAKDVDYLLVSLYWWRDCYSFIAFLSRIGLDPRLRKPTIIIGGMMTANPRPLTGYFHYAVVGDGEPVIGELLGRLERGEPADDLSGVWNPNGCKLVEAATLPAKSYAEIRTTRVTRIEIARGCKLRCAFCQLSATKSYRENPIDVIRQLILTAPTKTIALFAPDRASHSKAQEIEDLCAKYGKRNSGSDVRLSTLMSQKSLTTVRFGIEAFSERGRRAIYKAMSNEKLLQTLRYLSETLKTPKGANISMATAYVIADLPGEGYHSLGELWDVFKRWDETLSRKFTLFLSTSSFCPSPFTPLERAGIDPYSEFNRWFKDTRPHYNNLIIATRGGLIGPAQRLCQMLTIRGDERCRRALFHIATKEPSLLKDTSMPGGRRVESIVKATGFPPADLWRELPADYKLPWACVELPGKRAHATY